MADLGQASRLRREHKKGGLGTGPYVIQKKSARLRRRRERKEDNEGEANEERL